MTAVRPAGEVCRPVGWPDPQQAAEAANLIRRATGDTRRPYVPYRCEDCARWHIRRRPPFDPTDPEDHRRAELVDAGWRRAASPIAELWIPPGAAGRSNRRRRLPLERAWAGHISERRAS